MNIEIQETGQATIIELSGRLDGKTTLAAQEQIIPLLKDGSKLMIDLSRVILMSSAGLRLLISLRRQLAANGQLVLVGLSPQIKNTMEITGFLDYFSFRETRQEGLASLG
jgi:anti-sigma B factor antagonist